MTSERLRTSEGEKGGLGKMEGPADESCAAGASFRAKVYRLGDEGTWIDKGVGLICCEWLEQVSFSDRTEIDER